MSPKAAFSASALQRILQGIPWGILLKLLVSTGLIVWLFGRIDISNVWGMIQQLSANVVALALLALWGTLLAIAKRWQLVVRLGGIKAPLSHLAKTTFIGAFFNQLLPSSVGGDFFRILAVRRYGGSLNTAVTSVLIDRLFGFISLGILCLLALPAEGAALLGSGLKWPFLITLALLTAVLGGGILLPFIPQSWHASFLLRPFHPAIEMVQRALRQKGLFLLMLASALLSSILVILGLQILMVAFHIPLTWGQGAAILPVVLLLASLPISFAGWGLREGAIMVALGIYNVPQETALALSLTYGALHLASALPGLILWILEKHQETPLKKSVQES